MNCTIISSWIKGRSQAFFEMGGGGSPHDGVSKPSDFTDPGGLNTNSPLPNYSSGWVNNNKN